MRNVIEIEYEFKQLELLWELDEITSNEYNTKMDALLEELDLITNQGN